MYTLSCLVTELQYRDNAKSNSLAKVKIKRILALITYENKNRKTKKRLNEKDQTDVCSTTSHYIEIITL